jgi:glycosyltransferase family protein
MNIHYGKAFQIPRKIVKYTLAFLYPLVIKIWPMVKVKSIPETLDELTRSNKSIIRFGDSEFLYICDKLSLPYQEYNLELAQKMSHILSSNDDQILVGLPSGFHSFENLDQEGTRFWKSIIGYIYPRLKSHLNKNKIYYNASVTRIYAEYKDKSHCQSWFEQFISLWEGKDIVVIEGSKTRMGVGNNLFDKANSVKRILGPYHHGFRKYNELLEEGKKLPKLTMILVSMGPCAKALAYELAKEGYRVLDVGNLDIEYEWYLRGSDSKVKIPGKYTSEAPGGRIVEDVLDRKYNLEIIANYEL